ncbi:hypothetical protein D3C76_1464820 [compost metagenome]
MAADTDAQATLMIGQGDSGQHLMLAPGKGCQHRQGIFAVLWLAENSTFEHHGGIGTQHRYRAVVTLGQRRQAGAGFFPRQTLDIRLGQFGGQRRLVDRGTQRSKGNADLGEQLTAAWRARGQVQQGHLDVSLSASNVSAQLMLRRRRRPRRP